MPASDGTARAEACVDDDEGFDGQGFDGQGFDAALLGRCARLVRSDGVRLPLAPRRWHDEANDDDRWILDRCAGRTLDLGCGPGRLVVALAARGVPVLGVDVSAVAVARCHARGAAVIQCDALGPLPGEGRWTRVVLADGNIGIGGDPVRLLRRCRALLTGGGSVIVELEPAAASWRGLARLDDAGGDAAGPGRWFPWAVVGADALDALADRAGLVVSDRSPLDRERCFAELAPPRGV